MLKLKNDSLKDKSVASVWVQVMGSFILNKGIDLPPFLLNACLNTHWGKMRSRWTAPSYTVSATGQNWSFGLQTV